MGLHVASIDSIICISIGIDEELGSQSKGEWEGEK